MNKPEGEVRLVQSGGIPFAVDLHLQTYEGLGWIRRRLRGQSGWLQVGRATMDTYWGRWSTTLVVAVTDKGELLSKSVSRALLEMRSANPREPDETPDDDLEGHLEMAYWDFLGRCDIRHLKMLDEAEADMAGRVEAEQARGEGVLAEVELYLSQLNRQRRSATTDADRDAIMTRITVLEQKHREAAAWLVRRLAAMRLEGEQLEADLLVSLQNHGQLEIIQTIRWVARHPFDRIYQPERPSFLMSGPNLPVHNEEAERLVAQMRLRDEESDERRQQRLTIERAKRLHRWNNRPVVKTPRERKADQIDALAALQRGWAEANSKKRTQKMPAPKLQPLLEASEDKPAAVGRTKRAVASLRTRAQKGSALRRHDAQARANEIAALLAQFPTVSALDRQLDRLSGTGIENRRMARLLRDAIKQLSSRRPVVKQDGTAAGSVATPLVRTTMDELVPAAATDSIDIDALIDTELRDMLKDLQ